MVEKTIEKNLSSILSNDYVLEVNSGTAGIIISLMLPENNRDEVILPSICCPSVLSAINFCNMKPIFVDMEKKFFNMDINNIKNSINKNTRAIIGVHSYGIGLNVKEIKNLCDENNILFIEDCCLSIGGKINNKPIGSYGDVSIFSFGYDKIISSAGGGIAFKNEEDFNKAEKLIEKNEILKCPAYKNEEIQIGFDNLEENIINRNNVAKIYSEKISDSITIKPEYRETDVYWRYPLLFKKDRNELINKATERNLIITYHYPSLANFQYGNDLVVSDDFNNSVINLFVNIKTDDRYIEEVCTLINEYE